MNALWMSLGGEVRCEKHAGYSLESAIAANPKARKHVTDLTIWTRLTAAETRQFRAMDLGCESHERKLR